MIRVVRGHRKQLDNYFSKSLKDGNRLLLAKAEGTTSNWEPLCYLLNQISEQVGPQAIDDVLAEDLAAASFAYEDRIALLTDRERSKRHYYGARYSSHLSHNWYIHRPLFQAWAKLLYRALTLPEVSGKILIVPNSQDMIGPINAILKTISRLYRHAKSDFTIVIGFEINTPPPTHDQNGINWNLGSANPRFSGGLLQVADFVENAPECTENEPNSLNLYRNEVSQASSEHTAYQTLNSSKSLNNQQVEQIINAMTMAYQGLGFQNTLELGLKLLEFKTALNRMQKANVHGLIGLAAHNRQFSATDQRLHEFLLYHFTQAYKYEVDPGIRSALCYRIAVTRGRRMKQPKDGLKWAEKALVEAKSKKLSETEQVYYHNWGINIKAYLLMMTRQLEVAYETGESVFNTVHQHFNELLETPNSEQNADATLWQREFFATVQVLRRNMFALCYYTAKLPEFRYWLDKMEETTPSSPEVRRATYVEWAEYYSALLQPTKVLTAVETGFGHLEQEPESELFLDYSKHAITANYQVGNLTESHDHLNKYRGALDDIAMPWYFEFDLIKYAPIYFRHGNDLSLKNVVDLSEERINADKDDPVKCVEYLLIQGQVYAKQQEKDSAEKLINDAINIAVEHGERNLMMRVARVAGSCSDILASPGDALQAYRQSLELSQHEADIPPWPEELFLTLIAIQAKEGPSIEHMEMALGVLPAALEQMEPWWELSSMLQLLVRLAKSDQNSYHEMTNRQSLQAVVEAARQRDDCANHLEQLLSENNQVEILPLSEPQYTLKSKAV